MTVIGYIAPASGSYNIMSSLTTGQYHYKIFMEVWDLGHCNILAIFQGGVWNDVQ